MTRLYNAGLSQTEVSDTLLARFELKCGKPDENGCIPWLGHRTRKGYGCIRVTKDHAKTTAHRAAWVLKRGDIPPEISVLHRCDNPTCVNVDHLFLGTPLDNVADMVQKGRQAWRFRTPWQKLNSTDGERISDLRRMGHTQQEIADWLAVSRPLISMILAGKINHSLPFIRL